VVSFPQVFPTKTLYTPLPSPIRATCPAHLILLDFITRTILGEEYSVEVTWNNKLIYIVASYWLLSKNFVRSS